MSTQKRKSIQSIVFALFVLTILFCANNINSQVANSSPYSRYGIGDQGNKGFGQNFAMGGTIIAMQNDSTPMFFINSGNPASYSNIRLTAAELGVNFNRLQLQSAGAKKTINNASLAYVSLAFPFTKWWGASFGLLPYSSVGYKVSDRQDITNVGIVNFLYEGSGGINQVYFGNGIKPLYGLPGMFMKSKKYRRLLSRSYADNTLKNDSVLAADHKKISNKLKCKRNMASLSLGFNASYMFGNIDNTRRSIFASNTNSFNTRTGTTTRVGGVYFDYGAQYAYTFDSLRGRDLKDNVKLLLGATFSTQTDINAKIDSLSYTYKSSSSGYEVGKDTIQNSEGTKGKIVFPLSFGFGFGIKKGDKWLIAADYALQNWSTYKAFNKSQGLKNSMRVSLGLQYVPNSKANGKGSYAQRLNYRIGAHYAQTSLELKNTPLTEVGISLGLGFPVGRSFLLQSFSMVNMGLELGQRGTTTNGLIREQFIKATIGFTLNDRWFVKPKFD